MWPAFERFQAELERVPTGDPALRSGRAEWRATVAAFALFSPVIEVCGTLDRWRRSRFARAEAPFGLGRELLSDGSSPKLTRAARRMQELGVARGTARRFTGETLLDGIGEDLDTELTSQRART
jgi:hypothetical protein